MGDIRTKVRSDLMLRRSVRHHATFQRGTISCQKCLTPIQVFKVHMIASEFSVLCMKCYYRGLFQKHYLKIEILPERRKKPRD